MKKDLRTGILLYGYFGAGNLGDDLLLAVTVLELRAILPGAQFFVLDHGDLPGLGALSQNVALTGIETILADRTTSRAMRLWAYLRAYSQLFRQCQWLIFAGGTVFHERGTLTTLALQWLICLLARLQGVHIAALGVGVAELDSAAARWLLRRIIGMSALFLVRDDAALLQCERTKARLTDDLVFAWSGLANCRRAGGGAARIGLTIYPPACKGPTGVKVVAALADAVRRWQVDGHAVSFIVCQRSGVADGDESAFALLTAALGPQAVKIESRYLGADPAVISELLADIDVLCGMRFHVLVLAAMLGRPFAGITHDNKISEICCRFDMPCYTADKLAGAQFAESVEAIKDRVPDVLLVQRAYHSAKENFRAFAALAT